MIEFAQYVPSCILKNPQTVPTHIDNFSYIRTTFQVNNRVIRNELVIRKVPSGFPFSKSGPRGSTNPDRCADLGKGRAFCLQWALLSQVSRHLGRAVPQHRENPCFSAPVSAFCTEPPLPPNPTLVAGAATPDYNRLRGGPACLWPFFSGKAVVVTSILLLMLPLLIFAAIAWRSSCMDGRGYEKDWKVVFP